MTVNPWKPITNPLALKHLGKLVEELNEAGSAAARCLIQGVDECEPETGKPNRQWLTEEIADVFANADLVIEHFGLDIHAINERIMRKKGNLRRWHAMVEDAA